MLRECGVLFPSIRFFFTIKVVGLTYRHAAHINRPLEQTAYRTVLGQTSLFGRVVGLLVSSSARC